MKKWAFVGILVLVIAGAAGYFYYRQNQADLTSVKVIKVGRQAIQAKVYATGNIDMANKQEVRVTAPALVKSVAVRLGQQVKKGDTLLQLDTEQIDLQVQQARASVNVAKAAANAAGAKVAELTKIATNPTALIPGAGSAGLPNLQGSLTPELLGSTLTDAKNALAQAQAVVKQTQAALAVVLNQQSAARITANMDGTVLAINTASGQPAAPQLPLMVVGDLHSLIVSADVNEVDAGKLAPGQAVEITGSTLGKRTFTGTVISVAPMAQSQTSAQGTQITVPVEVAVKASDPALKPGFTVSLAITTSSKPMVLQVPLEAIFSHANNSYVYVVKNGSLLQVKVTTGIAGDVNMEITAGLNEGDLVVLNPSNDLYAGLKVKVD